MKQNIMKRDGKRLNEDSITNLLRYTNTTDVVFITAHKSAQWIEEHYEGSDASIIAEINKDRNLALKSNLQAMWYKLYSIDFLNKEIEGFAVIGHDESSDEFIRKMTVLAEKYAQNSFAVIKRGTDAVLLYHKDIISGKYVTNEEFLVQEYIENHCFFKDFFAPRFRSRTQLHLFAKAAPDFDRYKTKGDGKNDEPERVQN